MSIRKKTEEAFAELISESVACPVYVGTRGEVAEHPCVVVVMTGSEEMPPNTGNVSAELVISVQGTIDEAIQNSMSYFDEVVEQVQGVLMFDNLASDLSAKVADFTCIGIMGRTGPTTEIDDGENMIAEVFNVNALVGQF